MFTREKKAKGIKLLIIVVYQKILYPLTNIIKEPIKNQKRISKRINAIVSGRNNLLIIIRETKKMIIIIQIIIIIITKNSIMIIKKNLFATKKKYLKQKMKKKVLEEIHKN